MLENTRRRQFRVRPLIQTPGGPVCGWWCPSKFSNLLSGHGGGGEPPSHSFPLSSSSFSSPSLCQRWILLRLAIFPTRLFPAVHRGFRHQLPGHNFLTFRHWAGTTPCMVLHFAGDLCFVTSFVFFFFLHVCYGLVKKGDL